MKYKYTFHPKVYIADDITVKQNILLRWLNSKKTLLRFDYYVVYISDRSDELLTMVSAKDINCSAFGLAHRPIIAVGRGYYGTIGLIHKILRDILESRGQIEKPDVISFFETPNEEVTSDEG